MDHRSEKPHHPHAHHQKGGRFMDGLLVGLILGFGLALLITTKKGRRMLKMLTEEGLDSVSELKKRLDNIEVVLDENDDEEEEYIVEEMAEDPDEELRNTKREEEGIKKSPRKRLFKGISRKN